MATSFLRKLQHGAQLSDRDKQALEDLCRSIQQIGARQDIVHEGDSPRHLTIVLQG